MVTPLSTARTTGLIELSRAPHHQPSKTACAVEELFLAFAQRRSAAASSLFAARIQRHLQRCGVCLRDLVWQTDNGRRVRGQL